MDAWDGYVIVVAVAVVLAIAHAVHAYRGTAGRWGEVRLPLGEVGEGAYRSAPTFAVVTPRAPGTVLRAGLLGRVWGAVTLLVFVPAGAVATLLFVALVEETFVSGLLARVLGALVLSGLGLSFALFAAATTIEERREPGTDVRDVVRWSLGHHALVALVFLAEGLALDPEVAAVALVVVVPVCAIGVGVALALRSAAKRAADVATAS